MANLHILELNILVTLATDVILLLIMFFGLLRLGFHECGTFGLGRLMWKQVGYWCIMLAVVFSAYIVVRISQGCHLALSCHYCRSPACGEWIDCVPLLSAHRDFMSQVFLCLNLNGRLLYPFLQ
jgi:hypothetical protein